MSEPIILVSFYSCGGATEKLALAAAVGAVQARALIRLRRVSDASPERMSGPLARYRETLARMRKEYVAPAEADILAADGIVFAARATSSPSSEEWLEYLRLLERLRSAGKLRGKVAGAVVVDDPSTVRSFSKAIVELGLIPVAIDFSTADILEQAVAMGRKIAEAAAQQSITKR